MRLARSLFGTWLVLGGITACSDHNPTVVFVVDAGVDGKSEAGSPQDGGGTGHDGGAFAEVAVAAEVGGSVVDVRPAVDQAPDANPPSDVAIPPDVVADQAADLKLSIDSPPAVDADRAMDGANWVYDGAAAMARDGEIELSAALDGGGTGG